MEKAPNNNPPNLTEAELFVRRSDEDVARFEAQRIADALMRETKLSADLAHQISVEVKEQIKRSGIRALTSSLIRGLVDAKLIEYGQTAAHRAHARLGVPLYDVDRIIQSASVESSVAALGPEGTSMALAEAIKREYAILAVFSDQVADAHLSGDLHIENLGEVDRPTAMTGSVDFIKRFGIVMPGGFAGSKPARRPEVLAAHLVKYNAALHGYFSEAVAWDSVNFAMAPLLAKLDQKEMKQVAQGLLFELSAPAIARGGQPVNCDLHLDWDAPAHLRHLPATGAGGETLAENYGSFGEVARQFLKALFEVYLEGDGQDLPFTGPRPVLHFTRRFIESPGYRGFLDLVSRVATERGGVVFAFDRPSESGNEAEEAAMAFTARYGIGADQLQRAGESWRWRATTFSSVAINLPRIGYRAEGSQLKVFELLTELLELAAQASLEKRIFLEKLLARGEAGSLAMLAMRPGKEPFLRLNWTAHGICPIGLSELVQIIIGESPDASAQAKDFASRVVAHLHAETERLSAKHKVRFRLAESHDLTAPHRLARLDLKTFGEQDAVSSVAEGEAFYTNAARLPVTSDIEAFERVKLEGALQSGAIQGASSDIWLGEKLPAAERMAVFISRVFYRTKAGAITFSPEFTICTDCHAVTRGIVNACRGCGSARVDGLAQATNRYNRTSTWPQWKLTELKQRKREES
ncbi:MAG TPA: anaerobic ribonucleoside-triphosphate reductase [Blastocatellia bacterium]|nr:anaerobic ribonucleoside-triphosphate reductase [Blastocatellia bacterium]